MTINSGASPSHHSTRKKPNAVQLLLFFCLTVLAACSSSSTSPVGISQIFSNTNFETCPASLNQALDCLTPGELRLAYSVEPLIAQGYTGKGQTVIIIAELTSPSFQDDIATFDQTFGLPSITPQVLAPNGTAGFDPNNDHAVQAATEAELDVEVVHSFAPEAGIVVMTGPDLIALERYAVDQHLGQIVTQSFGIPESTTSELNAFTTLDSLFKQATLHDNMTFLASTGDFGAAGAPDAVTANVEFPASDPWVTAVGGTSLFSDGPNYRESAWDGSGGGVSTLYMEPDYQRQSLPPGVQSQLKGYRGVPDVAADADPNTAMACYVLGGWEQCGGTSASAPLWAAIVAIANQLAGHPLGFINPGLYKLGAANQGDFRDITSGSNSVTSQGSVVDGYQATPGWNAVTGWGVPRAYQLVADLITALH